MNKHDPEPRWLRLHGLKLTPDEEMQAQLILPQKAAAALALRPEQILQYRVHKKSLDARKEPFFLYVLDLQCRAAVVGRVKGRGLSLTNLNLEASQPVPQVAFVRPSLRLPLPPIIVGAGPAGLFATLALAEAGFRPLLLEQGQPVEQRRLDVACFWQTGKLDPASNVQFGEGGAGSFSDGKLTFRGKDRRAQRIFTALVEAGAPQQILYWHKPHLGSDLLLEILPRLRRRIEAAGGRFSFGTRLCGLNSERHSETTVLNGVLLEEQQQIPAQVVILAPGNGARATYELLASSGVELRAKPFAVGLRVEHPQALIDQAQYGAAAGHAALPVADYQLKFQADDRSFYSFCMCPGGSIVNAASEPNAVLTNGISLAKRASGWANSALVGAVSPGRDFADEPLAGLAWQRELEQAAFRAGGSDYALPVCMVENLLRGTAGGLPPVGFAPCSVGYRPADLGELLPADLASGLIAALRHWNKQLPGFAEQAVLAGLETRTSAPLRIVRGEDGQSVSLHGLYPAGEGAGYAGGIVSSAIDGLKAAEAVIERYLPPLEDFPAQVLNSLTQA